MHLGRGNTKHDYTMNSGSDLQTLEETTCEKDLGVGLYIDNVLKFPTHAERAANKGSQLVGMIRRSFDHLDGPLLVQLFKCFVRPHLEHGNTIWAPFYKKDITLIENVQRRATKTIPDIRDLSYEDRLRHLKLPSLIYRRPEAAEHVLEWGGGGTGVRGHLTYKKNNYCPSGHSFLIHCRSSMYPSAGRALHTLGRNFFIAPLGTPS